MKRKVTLYASLVSLILYASLVSLKPMIFIGPYRRPMKIARMSLKIGHYSTISAEIEHVPFFSADCWLILVNAEREVEGANLLNTASTWLKYGDPNKNDFCCFSSVI